MKAFTLAAVLLATVAAAPIAAAASGDEDTPTLKGTLAYTRVGGFAGADDALTVKRDGKAKLNERSFKLRTVERDALAKLLAGVDLKTVKVTPQPPAPDAFSYTIKYRGTTLAFDDGSVPKKVKKLNSLLSRLIQKYDGS